MRSWTSLEIGERWSKGVSETQDAMLAEAGEEDGFIKCFDDITGKELPWQAVKQSREKKS